MAHIGPVKVAPYLAVINTSFGVPLSIDAIQEFNIKQNNFGAQFGFGESIISLTTKSGQEDTSRVHRRAFVVSGIYSAKLPAMPSAVERFAEAVTRASPRMRFNWVATVLLEQPGPFQMALPAVGWLPETCGHHLLSSFN